MDKHSPECSHTHTPIKKMSSCLTQDIVSEISFLTRYIVTEISFLTTDIVSEISFLTRDIVSEISYSVILVANPMINIE